VLGTIGRESRKTIKTFSLTNSGEREKGKKKRKQAQKNKWGKTDKSPMQKKFN
jgi:hypothetical protein